MSPSSLLSGKKWSDLPASLHSHILSFLSNGRQRYSIEISLNSARDPTASLPDELLPAAKASADLAAVVADVLGPRAAYLTTTVANAKLAEWVSALGPAVKAVSTRNSKLEDDGNEGSIPHDDQKTFDRLCNDAIALFKALSANNVRLQVLDLKHVPFQKCLKLEEDLLKGLVNALAQSSESLKELALPATKLCAEALGRVSLKNLDICELEFREWDGRTNVFATAIGISAEAFMDMLRSLHGHADRSQKVSTLRELRLTRVHEPPCIDVEESQSGSVTGLFEVVRTLRLQVTACNNHEHSIALFISLFPNLECLDWNGRVTWKHLEMINRACPKMQDLHLRPCIEFTYPEAQPLLPDPDTSGVQYTLQASQGKMKTLVLNDRLSTEQMKVLGQSCPRLEQLAIKIGQENAAGLTLLLGTHCRQIRILTIFVVPCNGDLLRVEEWRTLAEAVRTASEELNTVRIMTSLFSIHHDPIEPTVQSMVDIIGFLGDRARSICFVLPSPGPEYGALVDSMCRILRTCATQTKWLERLEVDLTVPNFSYIWKKDVCEKEMLLRFVKEREDLLEQVPHLRKLSLGSMYEDVTQRLTELGV